MVRVLGGLLRLGSGLIRVGGGTLSALAAIFMIKEGLSKVEEKIDTEKLKKGSRQASDNEDKMNSCTKFVFRDQLTKTRYVIPLLDGPIMDQMEFFDSDLFDEKILPEIEKRGLEIKFGVHDVLSFKDELLGFTTYEIEETEKWDELLAIWSEIFISLGYKVGAVIKEKE